MSTLFRFDASPRRYTLQTPPSYEVLAESIEAAEGSAFVDFDPRLRTLMLLTHEGEGDGSPFYTESLLGEGVAEATRMGVTVRTHVRPGADGDGVTVTDGGETGSDSPAPVAHGVRRACRRGPVRGYPIVNAQFTVSIVGKAPSIGDLHATAQQAASRALAAAGAAPLRTDGTGNGEAPAFPDLDTSTGDTILNLRELCDWPIAELSESDRSQVGAYLAYQASLVYGHTVDERMARVPAAPPIPLRPFLATVTDDLVAYAATKGIAGEMVIELIRTWTAGWREA